jgi:hypothetical protein
MVIQSVRIYENFRFAVPVIFKEDAGIPAVIRCATG